ncbi:MAG TPA: DUF2235 domain-containing protein [Acetobacteraceae bacterium]|jgi:uncharacterized protein (DUF2235 family)|nr:DUF2235 domain-containing protein [Acetobacteraceae bacterium]
MAKNIVFCADGTWNGPGEADADDNAAPATNVFKLFLNLEGRDSPDTIALAKEQERWFNAPDGSVAQIAKYIHGVGDSNNFLVKLLGGAMGAGLITRIVRGYTFISRNYCSGDRIFITGFSRGAYTARALAGLISNQGLLDATKVDLSDKTKAYRLGAGAWYAFRKSVASKNWLDHLADLIVDMPLFFTQPPSADLRISTVDIQAVAVWDTVGALGIPAYTLQATRLDPFQFADLKLSDVVRNGLHAIAVDEQRGDFTPTLWDQDGRITQALFPGAHADVGGGYPISNGESALSDCSLTWMTDHLAKLGVNFVAPPALGSPDAAGVAHQPWADCPWTLLERKPRQLPPGLEMSASLTDRLRAAVVRASPICPPGPYLPQNLKQYPTGMV